MLSDMRIETRGPRHYAGVRKQVTMARLGAAIGPGIDEVRQWLDAHGLAPSGAPLVRYFSIDMDRPFDIDIGLQVATPVHGDTQVQSLQLPAGRYAVARYTGTYTGIGTATGEFERWVDEQGLHCKMAGERWASRVEIYETNPDEVPDPAQWVTELAFQVADED